MSISESENDDLQKAFNKAARWIFREKKSSINSGDIDNKAVQPFLNGINTILQDGFNRGIEHSVPFVMKRNLSENIYIFSGAKTYAELKELSGLLLDTDGNIKPFSKFWQDVQSIYPEYNQSYLDAEYIFATQSAQMASKWNEYETDGNRYNLQYRTANDDRVRESHWLLHNTTLPSSDPFWNDYFPPNGWRCRCTTIQVRKSKYPESDSTQAVRLGANATEGKNNIFRFNPGKQQVIFPKNHPYFKALNHQEISAIKETGKAFQKEVDKKRFKELRDWGKENLQQRAVKHPDLESNIEFTGTGIKEYLNQPHKYFYEKNEMIKDLATILKNSTYMGKTPYHKSNPGIIASHIFEIEINGEKTWLIARERNDGRIMFYSISDNKKVLKGVKK